MTVHATLLSLIPTVNYLGARGSASYTIGDMEPPKTCDRCGGVVDVTVVPQRKADGTIIRVAIGACRSCGEWFNEAALLALEWAEAR